VSGFSSLSVHQQILAPSDFSPLSTRTTTVLNSTGININPHRILLVISPHCKHESFIFILHFLPLIFLFLPQNNFTLFPFLRSNSITFTYVFYACQRTTNPYYIFIISTYLLLQFQPVLSAQKVGFLVVFLQRYQASFQTPCHNFLLLLD